MGGIDEINTLRREAYCQAICDVVNLLKTKGIFVDEIYDLYDEYKVLIKNFNKKCKKVLTHSDTSV